MQLGSMFICNCNIAPHRIFFRTNFNAHFNMNMYVTLSCSYVHVHIEVCIKVGSKKNILYYDARSEKHQNSSTCFGRFGVHLQEHLEIVEAASGE